MDTRFSKQVRNIIAERRKERGGRLLKLLIARQNFDGAEIEFADMLMEDHNNAALAYPDCASQALNSSYTDVYCRLCLYRLVSGSQANNRCRESLSLKLPDQTRLSLLAILADRFSIIWTHYTYPVVIASHASFNLVDGYP